MKTAKMDIYGAITTRSSRRLEPSLQLPMSWHVNEVDSVLPVNACTRRPYRGVNVTMLLDSCRETGICHQSLATYQQWRELGEQVRKARNSLWSCFGGASKRHVQSERRQRARQPKGCCSAPITFSTLPRWTTTTFPLFPDFPETERIGRAEQFLTGLNAAIRKSDREPTIHRQTTISSCRRLRCSRKPISGFRF